MNQPIYLYCGVNDATQHAFFNCQNDEGEQIASFVLDFRSGEKFVYASTPDESEIKNISPCGNKVLTIDTTYEKRSPKTKRKTKIFDTQTRALLFETNVFFGYEAIFTHFEHLIICRAAIKGKSDQSFVFDIEKQEMVHTLNRLSVLKYGALVGKTEFIFPNERKKDNIVLLNLQTLEETHFSLGSKKIFHRVKPLNDGLFFAIDGDMLGYCFNRAGEVLWKTQKMDWTTLYYAPEFMIFEDFIYISHDGDRKINTKTGEILEDHLDAPRAVFPYFKGSVITNRGEIIHLSTKEKSQLAIEKYL